MQIKISTIYIYIYRERERERANAETYKKMKQNNQKLKYYTHIFICYSYFTHTFIYYKGRGVETVYKFGSNKHHESNKLVAHVCFR